MPVPKAPVDENHSPVLLQNNIGLPGQFRAVEAVSETCLVQRFAQKNFGLKKIESNMARDEKNIKELRKDGWRVLVVWTCAFGNKKLSENTVEETISWLKSSDEFREISNQQPPERAAKIGTSEE